jgi:hypothetical protein
VLIEGYFGQYWRTQQRPPPPGGTYGPPLTEPYVEAIVLFKHLQDIAPLIIVITEAVGSADRAKGNRRSRVCTNYAAIWNWSLKFDVVRTVAVDQMPEAVLL